MSTDTAAILEEIEEYYRSCNYARAIARPRIDLFLKGNLLKIY